MEKSKEQITQQAFDQFRSNSLEKIRDILDSIGAVHGIDARTAAEAEFHAFVNHLNVLEVLGSLGVVKPEIMETIYDKAISSASVQRIVLFHLAVGAKIPADFEKKECFDDRAEELNLMFIAMLEAHQFEKEQLKSKVSLLLKG